MENSLSLRGKPATGTWRGFTNTRREKGWSQEDAAKYFGVSQTTISAWETCARYPDAQYLVPLSEFMSTTVDAILAELGLSIRTETVLVKN